MPAPQNVGVLLPCTEAPVTKAQFGFAASVVTAADQFVPPSFGAATSTTLVVGWLVTAPKTTIGGYRVAYTGDAANVAGQTISVRLQYIRAGVTADVPGSTVQTPIATTAGVKNGGKDLAAYFEAQPGDVVLAVITPSAALTAVVTGGMISLS